MTRLASLSATPSILFARQLLEFMTSYSRRFLKDERHKSTAGIRFGGGARSDIKSSNMISNSGAYERVLNPRIGSVCSLSGFARRPGVRQSDDVGELVAFSNYPAPIIRLKSLH
jgi:hypothetical protein